MNKKLAVFSFLVMVFFATIVNASFPPQRLHLYTWSDFVPQDIIHDFERETGIKVIIDVYDSNDVLEAKLLTGTSGYDVVCPSAWPYVGPQIEAGIYQPLNKKLLPNLKHLDPFLMGKLKEIDPDNQHVLPYMWGVTGVGYNKKAVQKCYPEAQCDSLAILFDEKHAKRLSKCGISLLDEAVDVIPLVLIYLGLDPNSQDPNDLKKAADLLGRLHPYITRFGIYQSSYDLGGGDLCAVLGWSTEILKAIQTAEDLQNGIEIGFIVPKEGTSMWVDVFAIPKSAPHPENAHKFINFIMRPEIAARASNAIAAATANKSAVALVDPQMQKDPAIYVPDDVRQRLFVDKVMPPEFIRLRSRVWLDVKSGRSHNDNTQSKE